jgi:hypothetical protein
MKTFKDTNNQLHVIDEAFTHLLTEGCIEITNEEAEAIRVSQLPIIDPLEAKRQEARAYLASTDYMMTADYDKDTTEVKALRAEARQVIRGAK